MIFWDISCSWSDGAGRRPSEAVEVAAILVLSLQLQLRLLSPPAAADSPSSANFPYPPNFPRPQLQNSTFWLGLVLACKLSFEVKTSEWRNVMLWQPKIWVALKTMLPNLDKFLPEMTKKSPIKTPKFVQISSHFLTHHYPAFFGFQKEIFWSLCSELNLWCSASIVKMQPLKPFYLSLFVATRRGRGRGSQKISLESFCFWQPPLNTNKTSHRSHAASGDQ